MKSGVRVPYHLEVAEAQRTDSLQEQYRLEQEEIIKNQQEIPAAEQQQQQQLEATKKQQQQQLQEKDAETTTTKTLQEQQEKQEESEISTTSTSTSATNLALRKQLLKEELALTEKSEKKKKGHFLSATLTTAPAHDLTPVQQAVANINTNPAWSSELTTDIEAKRKPISEPPIFVPTAADPPSLSSFETLKNMPTVPRYDAFYKAPPLPLPKFRFSSRFRYLSMFNQDALTMDEFLKVDEDAATSVAHQYHHAQSGTLITLLPVAHVAHPTFWTHADVLCCQHHSVLMEGRYSPASHDISVVPPRSLFQENRPEEEIDAEGWEPSPGNSMENFRQPYGWGVRDSPEHTIVHAADSYDYDKLPIYARLRWNFPFLGNYTREKRCLNILHELTENGYESFCIPWGVAHMPVFAKILRQNGFEQCGTTRLTLFNRIDGPISAAYIRKLKSVLSWGRGGAGVVRGLVAGAVGWSWWMYMDFDMVDVINISDNNNGGAPAEYERDSMNRRAWEKAMAPSTAQERLRGSAI